MATILVVDDNAVVARMLARFLESKGHQAVIACSGAEALLAAEALPAPDLILLDLCMPEMDGIEVLRRLKLIACDRKPAPPLQQGPSEPSESPHVNARKQVAPHVKATPSLAPPVILFSAVDDPAVIAAAYRHGACDYWIKASFKFDDLPKAIEHHLGRCNG